MDEELFGAFAFYAGIVTIKMMVMSFLTARQRFKVGVFTSPEDAVGQGHKVMLEQEYFKKELKSLFPRLVSMKMWRESEELISTTWRM